MVTVKDRELRNMSEKNLYDTASAMNDQLNECIDFLEQMRKSNDTLRCWGIEEAERVDELESKVELLEIDIETEKSQCE